MVSAASRMADIGSAANAVPSGTGGNGAVAGGFSELLDSHKSGMSGAGAASSSQPAAAKSAGGGTGSKDNSHKGAHNASSSPAKSQAADQGKKKPDDAAHKSDQSKQSKADKGQTKADKGQETKDKKADKKTKGKPHDTDAKAAPYALLDGSQAEKGADPATAAQDRSNGKALPVAAAQGDLAKVIADASAKPAGKEGDGKVAKATKDPLSALEAALKGKDAGDKGGSDSGNSAKAADSATAVQELSRLAGGTPAQQGGGSGADASGNGGGQQSVTPAALSPSPAPASASPNSTANVPSQQPADLQLSVPMRAQGWNQAFAQRVTWMAKQGLQQAQIQLNPRHLGPIQVHLSVDHDQASVQFVAHNPHAREALQGAMPRLKEMMAENGMNLAQSHVAQQGFQQQQQQQFGSGSGFGQGGSGAGTGSDGAGSEDEVAAIDGVHALHGGTSLSAVDYFA